MGKGHHTCKIYGGKNKETKIARHCVNAFRILIVTVMGCIASFKDGIKGSEGVHELT